LFSGHLIIPPLRLSKVSINGIFIIYGKSLPQTD
jgi:hypothetical protein